MWLYIVGLLVFVVDQLSKFFVPKILSSQASLPVIPEIFHITLVHNTGIAFGLFKGNSPWLFLIIALSVIILLILSFSMRLSSRLMQVAYGMVLGGAVSNFFDRILRGSIVDYLDFRVWPVFNIADLCISVGVGLFFIAIWFRRP